MYPVYYGIMKEEGLVGKLKEQVIGGLTALTMKGVYWLADKDCPEVVSKTYRKFEDTYFGFK